MIVRDYRLTFGAQYFFSPVAGDRLTLGLTYTPGKTLPGTGRQVYYDTALDAKPQFSDEHKLQRQLLSSPKPGAQVSTISLAAR